LGPGICHVGEFKGTELVAPSEAQGSMDLLHFTYSMNKAKWDSLPKDIQDAITKVNNLENARILSRNWEENAMQEFLRISKGGVEPYTMPESELKKLYGVSKPLRDEWVKKMNAAGRSDAAKVLNRIQELIPLTAK